jgi:hypothetical protein
LGYAKGIGNWRPEGVGEIWLNWECFRTDAKIETRSKAALGSEAIFAGVIAHEVLHTIGYSHKCNSCDERVDYYIYQFGYAVTKYALILLQVHDWFDPKNPYKLQFDIPRTQGLAAYKAQIGATAAYLGVRLRSINRTFVEHIVD